MSSFGKLFAYGRTSKLVVKDLVLHKGKLTLPALGLYFLGIGAGLLAIGIAGKFASSIQSGKPIHISHYASLDPKSLWVLFALGLSILVLISLQSWMLFTAEKLQSLLAVEYQRYSMQRLLRLLAARGISSPAFERLFSGKPSREILLSVLTTNCAFMQRIAYILMGSIRSFVTVLACGLVMLIIFPWLTMLLVLVIAISMLVHARNSIHAAKHSRLEEDTNSKSTELYGQILRYVLNGAEDRNPSVAKVIDHSFYEGVPGRNLQARVDIYNILAVSRLTTGATFIVVVIVLFILYMVNNGHAELNHLVWLVLLINASYGSLKNAMVSLTSLNRFYQPVNYYFTLINKLSGQMERWPWESKLVQLVVDLPHISGCVMSLSRIEDILLPSLYRSLINESDPALYYVRYPPLFLEGVPIDRTIVDYASKIVNMDNIPPVLFSSVEPLARKIWETSNEPISLDSWRTLGHNTLAEIQLLKLLSLLPPRVICIDSTIMQLWKDRNMLQYLDAWAINGKILILYKNGIPSSPILNETAVMVWQNREIVVTEFASINATSVISNGVVDTVGQRVEGVNDPLGV